MDLYGSRTASPHCIFTRWGTSQPTQCIYLQDACVEKSQALLSLSSPLLLTKNSFVWSNFSRELYIPLLLQEVRGTFAHLHVKDSKHLNLVPMGSPVLKLIPDYPQLVTRFLKPTQTYNYWYRFASFWGQIDFCDRGGKNRKATTLQLYIQCIPQLFPRNPQLSPRNAYLFSTWLPSNHQQVRKMRALYMAFQSLH